MFLEGDMTKIPLEDDFCDVVCAIASFHHVPSDRLRLVALKEMIRIMKSDGVLVLSVWNLFQAKYKKYVIWSYLKWLISFGKFDLRDTFIPWGNSGIRRYYHAFH
jgi:ubiquinone/menaquinone biosynthesis C-methylase UbiE